MLSIADMWPRFQWIQCTHAGIYYKYFVVPTGLFNFILRIGIVSTSCKIGLRWVPKNLIDDRSTLVQVMSHYLRQCLITITSKWARWPFKSPASRSFTQPFIQAQIKENIEATRHWPLWGEFTGDRWIPLTKASDDENVSIWWRHHVYRHMASICCNGLCTWLMGFVFIIFRYRPLFIVSG